MNKRGTVVIEVVLIVALLGGGAWFLRRNVRQAKQSTAATQQLETATTAVGAAASAGVTSIGRAANDVPESPATDFIRREVPAVLSKLPPPDPQALLEAERRRVAVMEGKVELAHKLYESESRKSSQLLKERDEALAARKKADLELERTAAAEQARTVQFIVAVAIGVVLLAAWVYAKLFSITPGTLGRMAAEIRSGKAPIEAFDDNISPWLHRKVNLASRIATPTRDT